MKFFPLPESKLPNLKPLIAQMFQEGDLSEFTNETNFLTALQSSYHNQLIDAYVDDVESPGTLIVLLAHHSVWYDTNIVSVMSRYTVPEKRGDKDRVLASNELINNYAKLKGARLIMAGSRTAYPEGAAERVLEQDGFRHVESTYIKKL